MPCPVCKKPTQAEFKPFCSKRCADLDLGQWFTGGYALESLEPLGEEEIEQVIEAAEADEDFLH